MDDRGSCRSFHNLQLAVAGHLTLLVVRTKKPFLSKPYPAPILLVAILSTQIVAVLIVGFGFLVAPIPWSQIGLIWGYCIVWVFIEDWAKVHLYGHLEMSGKSHRRFIERIHERPSFLAF
jgi:H+-transporting ATPase